MEGLDDLRLDFVQEKRDFDWKKKNLIQPLSDYSGETRGYGEIWMHSGMEKKDSHYGTRFLAELLAQPGLHLKIPATPHLCRCLHYSQPEIKKSALH